MSNSVSSQLYVRYASGLECGIYLSHSAENIAPIFAVGQVEAGEKLSQTTSSNEKLAHAVTSKHKRKTPTAPKTLRGCSAPCSSNPADRFSVSATCKSGASNAGEK